MEVAWLGNSSSRSSFSHHLLVGLSVQENERTRLPNDPCTSLSHSSIVQVKGVITSHHFIYKTLFSLAYKKESSNEQSVDKKRISSNG